MTKRVLKEDKKVKYIEEDEGYEKDLYKYNTENVRCGIYTEEGELICKVTTMAEARRCMRDFRDIDKELTGKKNRYKIKEL